MRWPVITPIETPAALREEARRARQQREGEQYSPLIRALGLAHYWQQLLDDRKFRSIAEIAAAEGMDVGRVSRIARLTQLAPVMVEVCLADLANAAPAGTLARSAALPDWNLKRL